MEEFDHNQSADVDVRDGGGRVNEGAFIEHLERRDHEGDEEVEDIFYVIAVVVH